MSDRLTDARTELAEALQGMQTVKAVYDEWPSKPTVPSAIVVPGDPYITYGTAGTAFGEFSINLTVLLVTGYSASNKVVNSSMDALIVDVLEALKGSEFTIGEIEAPAPINVAGTQYLGAAFTVTTNY